MRADREKADGSAAGVAVGAVAQVLTSEYLVAEILAFLSSVIPPEDVDKRKKKISRM
jgi:hypothetical protein